MFSLKFPKKAVDDEKVKAKDLCNVLASKDETRSRVAALFERKDAPMSQVRLPSASSLLVRPNKANHRHLGCQAAEQQRYGEALSHFGDMMKTNPELSHLALEMSAQVFLIIGDFWKATTLAGKAIALSPDFVEGHLTLGRALLSFGEIDGAEQSLRDAARLSGSDAEMLKDVESELDEVLALQSRLSKRRTETETRVCTCVNGRLFGEMRFYELGNKVLNHGNDEAFLLLRADRPTCCSLKNDQLE